MKILIIYDSLYGNTEKIAQSIAQAANQEDDNAETLRIKDVSLPLLASADVIIFGSPTHGGQASKPMQEFLQTIPNQGLAGKKVAVFDTRIPPENVGRWLKLLMKTIGYTAPKMRTALTQKGAHIIGSPEGFLVHGKEGPLKDGELERAAVWTASLLQG